MKRIPLSIIIGISITVVGSSLYAYATYDMEKRIVRINEYKESIALKEGETSSFAQLATLVEETKEQRERVKSYVVPADEGVIDLLQHIESLATTTRAEIDIVSVMENDIPGEEQGAFEEMVIALSVSGAYGDVRYALALIEALPYPTKITQIRLESRVDGKKTIWSALLTIRVLKFK